MNSKESFNWYVQYCKIPGRIYNRIFRKIDNMLVFEMEIYTLEPVSLNNNELTFKVME